jgi:glycosyltransferase involved in cell wall biosynthesis
MRNDAVYDVILVSRQQLLRPHLGISRAVEQISQVFLELGLSVCIITEGPLNKESKIGSRMTVISLSSGRGRFRSMIRQRVPHPVSSWLSMLQEFLPQGRIVISPVVGLQSLIFRKTKSTDYLKVVTLYTPYSKYSLLGKLYFALQRTSLQYADLVIGNSKTILDKFKISESDAVRIIPNLSSFTLGVPSEKQKFPSDLVWIGALTYRKGVDRLLHFLIQNRGRNSVLIVWSKGRFQLFPFYILRIFECFGWCELKNNVSNNELSTILGNTKVLLSTTRFESFGMTLVEAASHGKGTIGIRAPGIDETLPESSGGALYFRRTSHITNFLGNIGFDSVAMDLGRNAKSFGEAKYNKSTISNLWKDAIANH